MPFGVPEEWNGGRAGHHETGGRDSKRQSHKGTRETVLGVRETQVTERIPRNGTQVEGLTGAVVHDNAYCMRHSH